MTKEASILDIVNMTFFFSSSFVIWLNVMKIYKDKQIRGVKLIPGVFFCVSCSWGIFYYVKLGQPWSVIGMILMAIANFAWTFLAIYYTKIKPIVEKE